jgi:hypothetical protein
MNEIIMQTLESFQDSQINLQSESARKILANKLEENLFKHINELVEEAVSVITNLD